MKPEDSTVLLSAHDLHKTYLMGRRSLEVLRGVSLSLQPGEFFALQGASGTGKSTLLHILGGLDLPNSGSVFLEGHDLNSLSPRQLARVRNERIGFIFQSYHLLPELDALENVCLPARLGRRNVRQAVTRGRDLLERVGLAERMEHLPSELSGGEQQRVAIARSMINDPILILADEPTGNLDSHTGAEILDLLCALQSEKQVTLVIATHDHHVAHRAHRIFELLDGQIVGQSDSNSAHFMPSI